MAGNPRITTEVFYGRGKKILVLYFHLVEIFQKKEILVVNLYLGLSVFKYIKLQFK